MSVCSVNQTSLGVKCLDC